MDAVSTETLKNDISKSAISKSPRRQSAATALSHEHKPSSASTKQKKKPRTLTSISIGSSRKSKLTKPNRNTEKLKPMTETVDEPLDAALDIHADQHPRPTPIDEQPLINEQVEGTIIQNMPKISQASPPANPANEANNEKNENIATLKESFVPYQHLGLLDPAWGIPSPGEGEKTMREYCSSFRSLRVQPEEEKEENKNDENKNEENADVGNQTDTTQQQFNTIDNENDQRAGPLVEVVDGEIVIRESSVIVGQRRSTDEVDRAMEDVVVEDNGLITATYASFLTKTRQKPKQWTVEETSLFYVALRQCGADFTTMESFFENRTRRQLRRKYLAESRKHPKLVDLALNPNVKVPLLDFFFFGIAVHSLNSSCL